MRKVFVLALLSAKRTQSWWSASEVEVSRLISPLSKASPNPVYLHENIFAVVDGILNVFAFGKNYGGKQFKNEKFQDVLVEAMKTLDSFSAEDFFPSVGWITDALTGLRARHSRCFHNLDNYFQMVIDEHIAKLKYLKMVVKETFRMHPAALLLIPHQTRKHCQINANGCKYDIFPQTKILVNALAIGGDPISWKNPDEFYPERFEGSDIDFKGQHFELLPFGAGRRICPGIAMAVSTVAFTLANLLYFFDWELPRGMKAQEMDMEEIGSITTRKIKATRPTSSFIIIYRKGELPIMDRGSNTVINER